MTRKDQNVIAGAIDGTVTCKSSQGCDIRANVSRLTRHLAVLEIYTSNCVLHASEVLGDFKISMGDRVIYSGRATVHSLVNTGTMMVCEVYLEDFSFDLQFFSLPGPDHPLAARFDEFFQNWQQVCRVLPEFKVAVADIQTFLIDLRRWVEHLGVGILTAPKADQADLEREMIDRLAPRVIPVLDILFERFESIAAALEPELRPVHRSYIQRHLHPIVLCAPFAWRTYHKPLGYAGDYEMVNMMLRDPQEGDSVFAKLFNVWLLQQGSAAAHRNRIDFLKQRLVEETAAAARAGRKARILNIGCGPAREVQEFLEQSELSNHAQFTLLDFNDETLQYTRNLLERKRQDSRRTTSITLNNKSMQQLLKDSLRAGKHSQAGEYDFVYCAGLFDYLPDHVCKLFLNEFYRMLAPGGLVLATNVTTFCPNRGSLELILDWHLIYRDKAGFEKIRPERAQPDDVRLQSDQTGFNTFMEARKSDDA